MVRGEWPVKAFSSRVPKSLRGLWGSLVATTQELKVNGVSVLSEVATELYESLSTPISLSCEILLRYGELDQLVRKTISPSAYNDHRRFRDDYQAVNFLRKVPFKIEGLDARAEAKRKFLEAEDDCKATNSRIRSFLRNPEMATSTVRQAFGLTIIAVREVLGDQVRSAEWLDSCRFGPGAFNHPSVRGLTSVYDKLQVTPSVTEDFRDAGAMLVMSSPSWARSIKDIEEEGFWPFVTRDDLCAVSGNRVTFVPKTAVTERAIAIEPLVNIYAQLGLGAMIRKRLRAFADVDLDDQSINQELAREGSTHGFLATIDLSSASDTIAKEMVRAILPDAWFSALDSCRSKVGTLDKGPFVYEKFSSMGNGFTFELESLIFWALARSACVVSGEPEMVSVYGDDIVVPVGAYETLMEILTFFGFRVNPSKSFRYGYFRESCGKDYYDGYNVRPFLQKEVPEKLEQLLALANGLRRLAHRWSYPFGCDVRLQRAWRAAVQSIPRTLTKHLRVPAHAGDTEGLVCDWDEAQTSSFIHLHSGGWNGWVGIRLAPKPDWVPEVTNFEGAVATLLYRCRNGFEGNYLPASPRQGRDVHFELRGGAFWGPWTDLGPWI